MKLVAESERKIKPSIINSMEWNRMLAGSEGADGSGVCAAPRDELSMFDVLWA